MATETLVMPAVMAFLLVALVYGVRSRGWRSYEIRESAGSATGRLLNWLWSSPVAWLLVFFVVTLGLGMAAIVAVSGDRVLPVGEGTGLTVVLGAIGGVVAAFLFFGTYFSIRSRGAQNSVAAVLSALLLGFVVMGVITLQLAGVF
jgi:hypothetical protein